MCSITYRNNNSKRRDAYFGKNSLQSIQSDVSIYEYRITKKYVFFFLFLVPYSFFLIPFFHIVAIKVAFMLKDFGYDMSDFHLLVVVLF